MDLLLLILISGGAVVGSCAFAYFKIKSDVASFGTKAAVGLIASQAGEAGKTAVQSLVGSKPYASEPGTANVTNAVAGVAGTVAGTAKGGKFIAGLASKLPGPIGAAAGAAMVGFGATAGVAEAVAKKGRRVINEKATRIANGAKLRFKGSKLGMALAATKSKVDSRIDAVKNKAAEIGEGVRGTVNQVGEGIRNTRVVRGAIRGAKTLGAARDKVANTIGDARKNVARTLDEAKANFENSISDTWGYNTLMQSGKELIAAASKKRHGGVLRITRPSRDPLLGEFTINNPENREKFIRMEELSHAQAVQANEPKKYKSESLKEFIKAKKDSNQRIMGSHYAKEYAEAKELLGKGENSRESMLKQRMMLDIVKSSPKDLNRDELLKATHEMYDNYVDRQGKTLRDAQKSAEEKNSQVALDTVEKFFGKDSGKATTEMSERLDEYLEATYAPRNAQERKKLKQETMGEIAGDLNGVAAKAILSDDERAKISQQIEGKSRQNVQFEVAKIENKQIQEYRTSNPNVTLSEARTEVKKQNNEIDYKKALEEAVANVELHVSAGGAGESGVSTPRIEAPAVPATSVAASAEPRREIVAAPTERVVERVVESETPRIEVATQRPAESTTPRVEAPAERVVERVVESETPRVEGTTERVIERVVETSAPRTEVTTERVVEKVVEGKQKEAVINNYTTSIDSDTIDQIANEVAEKVTIPFAETVSKSVDWIKKLGGGDIDTGVKKLSESMNKINEGSTEALSKEMTDMFNRMGNGNMRTGSENLRKAVDNINKGNKVAISGNQENDDLLYALADMMRDNKAKDATKKLTSRKRSGKKAG